MWEIESALRRTKAISIFPRSAVVFQPPPTQEDYLHEFGNCIKEAERSCSPLAENSWHQTHLHLSPCLVSDVDLLELLVAAEAVLVLGL